MNKSILSMLIFFMFFLCISVLFAYPSVDELHEMTGIIIDKDVSGQSIDYLIDINGTRCYLSCSEQPYEEFSVGDNVTMNGTIDMDSNEILYSSDFDGKYDGEKFPNLVLNNIVVNQHTYGQMRLTDDINNQYYKQLDVYNP